MKGKIDKLGYLHIYRAKAFKVQECPNKVYAYCGDWCPLFREPKNVGVNEPTIAIELCEANLIFTDFTDEREVSDETTGKG